MALANPALEDVPAITEHVEEPTALEGGSPQSPRELTAEAVSSPHVPTELCVVAVTADMEQVDSSRTLGDLPAAAVQGLAERLDTDLAEKRDATEKVDVGTPPKELAEKRDAIAKADAATPPCRTGEDANTCDGNSPVARTSSSATISDGKGLSPQGSEGRDSRGTTSPQLNPIYDFYDMWCVWLDNPEDNSRLEQMLQMLARGGEPFRSFLQFLARVTEPHRSAGLEDGMSDESIEDEAIWRSCTAMRVACHAFTAPNTSSSVEGMHVLNSICCQLLGGLQPRSRATSMHLSIVLQHILCAHDVEACDALLHNNAPFVLMRVLNHAGCKELLLGLLIGVDVPLPALNANQSLRPISTTALTHVLQYVRQTSFPALVVALLGSGARRACLRTSGASAGTGSSPLRSPAGRRAWPSPPCTPGGLTNGGFSPDAFASTPKRLWTPKSEGSPLLTLPAPPSSPSPSALMPFSFMELPIELPFSTSPPLPTQTPSGTPPERQRCLSPAPSRSNAGSSPLLIGTGGSQGSGSHRGSAVGSGVGDSCANGRGVCTSSGSSIRTPTRRSGGSSALGTPGGPGGAGSCTPARNGRASGADSSSMSSSCEGGEGQQGVGVLIDFLTTLLETSGRAWDQRLRPRNQQDQDAEARAEVRLQLLQVLFIDSAVIPHLFQLLSKGVAPFESAALLRALLTHAAAPNRLFSSLVEPLLGQFLPSVDLLGTLLLRNTSKAALAISPVTHSFSQARSDLRLNSYTVREPLGALRVTVVQILAILCDLAPERTLAALKPPIWGLLVQWFFGHRCNHIFQAACGRLFIAMIHHGNVRLQQLVLLKLKLFKGICEAVLAEGACGDRWHELRPQASAPIRALPLTDTLSRESCDETLVAGSRVEKSRACISQKRHPGGLGGITPVLAALVKVQTRATDEAPQAELVLHTSKKGDSEISPELGALPPENRQPLAPRAVPQAVVQTTTRPDEHLNVLKPTGHTPAFVARLLQESTSWPQVVNAISRPVNA